MASQLMAQPAPMPPAAGAPQPSAMGYRRGGYVGPGKR
jgi:hypothetical protein